MQQLNIFLVLNYWELFLVEVVQALHLPAIVTVHLVMSLVIQKTLAIQ